MVWVTIFQILSALQLSGSLMLLEFLISIFCRETQHVHEDEIQNAIDKFTRRWDQNVLMFLLQAYLYILEKNLFNLYHCLANSADDKLKIVFIFFPENRI